MKVRDYGGNVELMTKKMLPGIFTEGRFVLWVSSAYTGMVVMVIMMVIMVVVMKIMIMVKVMMMIMILECEWHETPCRGW